MATLQDYKALTTEMVRLAEITRTDKYTVIARCTDVGRSVLRDGGTVDQAGEAMFSVLVRDGFATEDMWRTQGGLTRDDQAEIDRMAAQSAADVAIGEAAEIARIEAEARDAQAEIERLCPVLREAQQAESIAQDAERAASAEYVECSRDHDRAVAKGFDADVIERYRALRRDASRHANMLGGIAERAEQRTRDAHAAITAAVQRRLAAARMLDAARAA